MTHLRKTISRKSFVRAMTYRANKKQARALYRATERIMRGKYYK